MIITNKLNVAFNYDAIDRDFTIFQVSTSNNYIDKGARVLDAALDEIHAVSVAFDYGKSAFLLFEKGTITQTELGSYLIREDDTLSVTELHSSQLWENLLFRLFLYALPGRKNNGELWESNLTGKYFVTNPGWMQYNGARLRVLQIDVTKDMCLTADATTFTDITKFGPYAEEYSRKFPMYALSRQKGVFKRVFTMNVPGSHVYIRKAKKNDRSRIDFLKLSLDLKERKQCKSWHLYDVIDRLRKYFSEYLTVEFEETLPINTINQVADKDYMEKVKSRISEKGINVFSLVEAGHEEDLEVIRQALEKQLGDGTAVVISDKPSPAMFNIALIHHAQFYADRELEDPYTKINRNVAAQAVTIEDSLEAIQKEMEKKKQPLLCTLLKELVIKDDITARSKICLDDWQARGFTESWVFGIENTEVGKREKRYFFMKISPDGGLEFAEEKAFKPIAAEYEECFNILNNSKERNKVVVSDGKNAIMIARTDKFPMPNPDIFVTESPRGNDSKSVNFNGLHGINYYREDGTEFYNVGYVDQSGFQQTIPNASVIYKTIVFKGENFIERFLETMNVIFVKHNSFTVVPFPVKYLREYIEATLAAEKGPIAREIN